MNVKGFFIIYFIIWILPVIPGIVIARRKNRSAKWFWFALYPMAGYIVMLVMVFIGKKETVSGQFCSNCGKQLTDTSNFCPFCGTKNEVQVTAEDEQSKRKEKRDNVINIVTGVSVLVIMVVLVCSLFFSVFGEFKSSEPYKHSIELIEDNAEIMEYLGGTCRQTGLISGSLNLNASGKGHADLSYTVKGNNGTASRVYVQASRENDVWSYEKINFYKEKKSGEYIDLLEE